MGAEHDALRRVLGRVGVWTFAFDARNAAQVAEDARSIESLGFPALWVPEGGGSRDVIGHLAWLLANTRRLVAASGIANLTARQPEVLQAGAVTLADAYGERLVLGVGVGHEYTTERRGVDWSHPLERTRAYLDRMDEAAAGTWSSSGAPVRRLLAALGDGMLRLASERALGAHTYFVPPEHTAHARAVLGPDPVLAVEQTVVLDADPASARAVAAPWAADYLEMPNYAKNWHRLGYTETEIGAPSERLVDAGVVWGSADAVAGRVRDHLDAGADHVCVQVIANDEADVCLPQLGRLAPLLLGL